jgi:hypothetical protein
MIKESGGDDIYYEGTMLFTSVVTFCTWGKDRKGDYEPGDTVKGHIQLFLNHEHFAFQNLSQGIKSLGK